MTRVKTYPFESPCLDCAQRKLACHSKCRKYIEFRTRLDQFNTKFNADKLNDRFFYHYNYRKKMRSELRMI